MAIYKDGSNYYFIVNMGIDPKTGKRKQKKKRGFKTIKEAKEAETDFLYQLNNDLLIDNSKINFKEFANEWITIYEQERNVKPGTIRVRNHEMNNLFPYLGYLKIQDINRKQYQNALNKLKEKGYAKITLEGIHRTGRMIFRKALEYEIIKKDPTEFAYVPKDRLTIEDEDELPSYMEKEELAKFLKTVKSHGLPLDYEIFNTLAYTGLRVGELCALTEQDFVNGELRVNKTYYNPKNIIKGYELVPPKTKSSKRKIDVDEDIVEMINTLIRDNKKKKMKKRNVYHDKGFVFSNLEGYPIYPKMIGSRMRRLLKLAKLPEHLTPHSLRHTHTSLLAEAGVELERIKERLGHSDDKITVQVYLHTTETVKKEDSKKFSNLMKNLF